MRRDQRHQGIRQHGMPIPQQRVQARVHRSDRGSAMGPTVTGTPAADSMVQPSNGCASSNA